MQIFNLKFCISRIDKDTIEERNGAIQNLWLQCYTQEEIAESVGMPRKTVDDVLARIRKYKIPPIPGIFTENMKAIFGGSNKANEKRINDLTYKIRKYEICMIPGIFTEDMPEDSAPENIKREAVYRDFFKNEVVIRVVIENERGLYGKHLQTRKNLLD